MTSREKSPLRILIADNHRMVREGIRVMLSLPSIPTRFDVDEAETTEEAIAKSAAIPYDVILMAYHLPGRTGPKATEIILKRRPAVCVIGLAGNDDPAQTDRMMRSGARGCVLRDIEPDTLVMAIKTVLVGKLFYSNEIALKLLDRGAGRPAVEQAIDRLSSREREVFYMIISGLRDREIAAKLGIAKRTVDKHRQNLMHKLGARNAVDLVQAGVRMGVVG